MSCTECGYIFLELHEHMSYMFQISTSFFSIRLSCHSQSIMHPFSIAMHYLGIGETLCLVCLIGNNFIMVYSLFNSTTYIIQEHNQFKKDGIVTNFYFCDLISIESILPLDISECNLSSSHN